MGPLQVHLLKHCRLHMGPLPVPLLKHYCVHRSRAIWNSVPECSERQHGASGGVVVKALRYKPEGRGFETRCGE
jgi:hypothetical protein